MKKVMEKVKYCAFCGAIIPSNRKYCSRLCEKQMYRYNEVQGLANVRCDFHDEDDKYIMTLQKKCDLCGEWFEIKTLAQNMCGECTKLVYPNKYAKKGTSKTNE